MGRRPGDRAGAGRETELEEARRNSPEAVAARLFEGVGALEVELAADPAVLARLAARREAERATLDTVPLELIAQVAVGPQDDWIGRMALFDADENEPDYEVRASFWRRRAAAEARRKAELESARRAGVAEGRRGPGAPSAGRPAGPPALSRSPPTAPPISGPP